MVRDIKGLVEPKRPISKTHTLWGTSAIQKVCHTGNSSLATDDNLVFS